jgi:hypothetical protein
MGTASTAARIGARLRCCGQRIPFEDEPSAGLVVGGVGSEKIDPQIKYLSRRYRVISCDTGLGSSVLVASFVIASAQRSLVYGQTSRAFGDDGATEVEAVVIKIHGFKQSGRLPIVETGRAGHLALNEVGGRVMRPVASAAIPIRIRKSRDGSRCCQAAGRGRANNGAPLSSGPVLALLTVTGPAFVSGRAERRARKHSRPQNCLV